MSASSEIIISAGVLAGAYPRSHKWDEARTLIHAARAIAGEWPEPLCTKVKRSGSVTDDSTQWNIAPVTCPACLAKLRKLGVVIRLKADEKDGAPYCSHCGPKSACTCPPHPSND